MVENLRYEMLLIMAHTFHEKVELQHSNSCLLVIVNPLVPKLDCSCAVGAEKAETIFM